MALLGNTCLYILTFSSNWFQFSIFVFYWLGKVEDLLGGLVCNACEWVSSVLYIRWTAGG